MSARQRRVARRAAELGLRPAHVPPASPCQLVVLVDDGGRPSRELLEMCARCGRPVVTRQGERRLARGRVRLGRCHCSRGIAT